MHTLKLWNAPWKLTKLCVLVMVMVYILAMITPSTQAAISTAAEPPGSRASLQATWMLTGSMHTQRCCFTATLLQNGKVLVAGGTDDGTNVVSSAEIYDPATGVWTVTGSMNVAREQHTATLLPDGRVLVAGGVGHSTGIFTSAEIYDPATGAWTSTGSMRDCRADHTATLLPNGTVLVAGGYNCDASDQVGSSELYTPATGTWQTTGTLVTARQNHSATLLANGSVLVAGGYSPPRGGFLDNAEIYTPATGKWAATGKLRTSRSDHRAVLLPNGSVLVVGGATQQSVALNSTELYSPTTGTWTAAGTLSTNRVCPTAVLLPDNTVLVVGGNTVNNTTPTASTDIFNLATNTWTAGSSLNSARANHEMILLTNGNVLAIGGEDDSSQLASAELYIRATPKVSTIPDQRILENTATAPLPFTLEAGSTTLDKITLSATSSNPTLVPNANIVLAGTGVNRSVTVTSAQTDANTAPNRQGSAIITITANDGTTSTSTSFTLTVAPPPWLVMLYLAGDDIAPPSGNPAFVGLSVPVRALLGRLNRMPYNPNMRLAVVYDVNDPVPTDGSRADSRVFVRDPGGMTDVRTPWPGFPTNSELDTGSAATLTNFIYWARTTYPASAHSFLSLVDHGGGWAPTFSDLPEQPHGHGDVQAGGWRGMSLDMTSGGTSLSTHDTDSALRNAIGAGPRLDVIFFDACLMGMIESAYEVRNDADYLIAGENLLFADLPYERYLASTNLVSTTTPVDLASEIVDQYNAQTSASSNPFTIAALDLAQLRGNTNLATQVNTLADRLLTALPLAPVAQDNPLWLALQTTYQQTQKFDYDSSLTIDPHEGYVDLADFARRLRDSPDAAVPADVRAAADAVFITIVTASHPAVIRQKTVSGTYLSHPWDLSGSHGVSIYLPLGEQDYRPTKIDPTDPSKPALPERQLFYYTNCEQTCTQLAFTHDAARWSDLLLRLEQSVTVVRAPGGSLVFTQALANLTDQRPFNTPYPVRTVTTPTATYAVYLPIVMK